MRPMEVLGAALDEASRRWLSDTLPGLAEALEVEVERGATPEGVRRFVMQHTQRQELALRMEQAARAMGGDGR